jgi:hypothetical protein
VLKNNEAQAAVGRYNVQKFNECIEAPGGRSDCHHARGRIDFAAKAGGARDAARAFGFYRPPRLPVRSARGSSLVAHGASLRHLISNRSGFERFPERRRVAAFLDTRSGARSRLYVTAWRLEDLDQSNAPTFLIQFVTGAAVDSQFQPPT